MEKISASTVKYMVVQLIELGPFGARINRGHRDEVEDIPEGYRRVSLETRSDCIIVYIEPVK